MKLEWHHIGRVNFEQAQKIIEERKPLRLPSTQELKNDFLSNGDEQWIQHPSWYWSSEERTNIAASTLDSIRKEWVIVYKGNTLDYNNETGYIDSTNKDYECFLSLVSVEETDALPQKEEAPAKIEVPAEAPPILKASSHIIEVYIEDGIVFKYRVNSPQAVVENMSRIIAKGYRRNDGKVIEHYPPHRILKVKSENVPKSFAHSSEGL